MSNAKRIQKKVAKLQKRKYYKLRFFVSIDTKALREAVGNFKKAINEITESINQLNLKHEQL